MKTLYYFYNSLVNDFKFDLFSFVKNMIWYVSDLIKYKKNKNSRVKLNYLNLAPYLLDRTRKTAVEPVYFYQDTWFAQKIFKAKPKIHYDIGTSVKTIGIISQFTPCIFVDIRPPDIKLKNLNHIEGSILKLPFKSNSIKSLSSLCVIEHIGLGRYGDEIDSYGCEKAIKEVQRVLSKGGNLYISVPIDDDNKVYFNAHRFFTREYIMGLFDKCKLIEEKYIYGKKVFKKYSKSKGFGTGLYYFKKK